MGKIKSFYLYKSMDAIFRDTFLIQIHVCYYIVTHGEVKCVHATLSNTWCIELCACFIFSNTWLKQFFACYNYLVTHGSYITVHALSCNT